jgi:DNA adenine methylase
VIERLTWSDFIDRYDRPDTLFYLDPPYHGGEADYGRGMFAREDFARMAEQLAGIQGRFVLSINDVPEIREIFAAFECQAVELKYSVAKGVATDARELIVRGPAGR